MSDSSRRKGHIITANQQTQAVSISPIDEYRGQHRMQADKGSQIQDEKDNLATIQQEIRDIEGRSRAAQDHLNRCQSRVQTHLKQKKDLKLLMDRAHEDMGRLEDEVNACTPDAAHIEELEKELAVAQERVEMDEKQYADFITQKDKADNDARLLKNQLDEASKILREAEFRFDKVSTKVRTLTDRRGQALRRKNEMIEEVAEIEKNKAKWDEERGGQHINVTNAAKEAIKICPRVPVPTGETADTLKRKHDSKRQAREAAQSELGGSEDELIAIANDAKKRYVDAQKMVNGTESVRSVSSRPLSALTSLQQADVAVDVEAGPSNTSRSLDEVSPGHIDASARHVHLSP
jgi:DNA repair exonuclease SbcCD ATPase subunit